MKTRTMWFERAAMLLAMAGCALAAQDAFAAKADVSAGGTGAHLEDAASLTPTPMPRAKAMPKTSADTYEATGDLGITMSHGQTITLHFDINKAYTRITSARLVLHMWDVDYPSATEQDNVYFNGTYLGRLEGLNNGWDYNYFDVPISKITVPSSGESSSRNTVTIEVSVNPSGWVTRCGSAQLIINGDTFSLTASRNLIGGISVNWDNVYGSYDLWRKGPDDSDFTRIRQGITTNGCFDTDVQIGKPYTYYAMQSGAKYGGAKDATPNGASSVGVGLAGATDKPTITGIHFVLWPMVAQITDKENYEVFNAWVEFSKFDEKVYDSFDVSLEAVSGKRYGKTLRCPKLRKIAEKTQDGVLKYQYVARQNEFDDLTAYDRGHYHFSLIVSANGTELSRYNFEDKIFFPRDKTFPDSETPLWVVFWKEDAVFLPLSWGRSFSFLKDRTEDGKILFGQYNPSTRTVSLTKNVLSMESYVDKAYHKVTHKPMEFLSARYKVQENPTNVLEEVALTLAHEGMHAYVDQIFRPMEDQRESDRDYRSVVWNLLRHANPFTNDKLGYDRLPNRVEENLSDYFGSNVDDCDGCDLLSDDCDTYDMGGKFNSENYRLQGDNEFLARRAALKQRKWKNCGAAPGLDYAFPGCQSGRNRGHDITKSVSKITEPISSEGGMLSIWPAFEENVISDNLIEFSSDNNGILVGMSPTGGASALRFNVRVTCNTNEWQEITNHSFEVRGYLADKNGSPVAWTVSDITFTNKSVDVALDFAGEYIYAHRGSGYSLKYVSLALSGIDIDMVAAVGVDVASTVEDISADAFAGKHFFLTDFHENVVDKNLKVHFNAEVKESGVYTFKGHLAKSGTSETVADTVTVVTNLTSGATIFPVELSFPGQQIYLSGVDGAYSLSFLTVSRDETAITARCDVYDLTNQYNHLDFKVFDSDLSFIDGSASFGTPAIASDGFLGALPFPFTINNSGGSGKFHVTAVLEEACSNKQYVASYVGQMELTNGLNLVSLSFQSGDIRASGIDGPYAVRSIRIQHVSDPSVVEVFRPNVISGEYKADDFGKTPVELVGTPVVNTSGSAPVVTLMVEGLRDCVYNASAVLLDSNREFVAYVVTTNTIAAGVTNTVTLAFDESVIIASGHRGPYILDYVMLEPQNGADAAKLYSGAAVSDIDYTVADAYVDAVNGSDSNGGTSWSDAYQTIQAAVNVSMSGDTILVADGTYAPFQTGNKEITIQSRNGPRYTIVDGGGTNRCATLGTSAGHTNTVLRGFTLRNGNASGSTVKVSRMCGGGVCFGTLEDCHIYGNTAYTYQYSDSFGGGAYAANLRNCIIGGNWGYSGGGVHLPRLASGAFVVEECVFTRNRGSTGSAIFVGNGTGESPSVCKCLIDGNWATGWIAAYDAKRDNSFLLNKCTVIGNSSHPYSSAGVGYASAIDSIIWDNRTRVDVVDNHTSAIMTNCCTTPLPSGVGNISDNPQFVDAEHRVYQLMPDSPCIGAASNGSDMGASVVAPTSGFVIGTDTDGYGLILEPGTVVEDGGNVAFTAAEIGREFLHFKTNGVFATSDRVLELSNIHSDILVTAVFARREFFVDAANGNDGNDGLSWATARRSITSAINDTMDYDIITVMNGVYSPITPGTKKIKIQSVNGAAETVIDGGAERICVSCYDDNGAGITNTLVVGFTLRNGYAPYDGGGAHGAILRDCVISHNQSDNSAGGTSWSRLENCVVTCNKGSSSGGSYAGSAERSTFCGNVATMNRAYGGVSGTVLSDCIVYGNEPRLGDDNENPLLVDAWNGDARLRVGSPCIVNGIQVRGAYVGVPVEGVSVSVGVQGTGTVSNETILVLSGSDATIEVVETARPFLYWIINGEQVEDRIYTLTNVTTDVRAIAVFGTYDWYVDAEYGDDANDGSDWDTAKRTLQAAVAVAVDDEVIYVEAGTYDPISTDNKRIRIESVNGAEMTFIDGGGTSRCATLGTISTHTNSALVGFTLMNGRAPQSGSYSYGGGSYYGTLEYCIISNCVANGYYAYGGGAYYGNLNNCLVAYNCATSSSYRAYGGGTYGSYLRSTTIARNRAIGVNAAYYGGAYGDWNSAYNSIIWDNEVRSSNASSTYYPNTYATYLYYCCTDGTVSYRQSGCVTNDPQFVDADAGDFHLKVGSPCLNAGYDWYVQGDMDLDWDDRIQGGAVDMGCYEGAEYAAPPGQVTGLVAVRGVLEWDAMPDAEGFMVYRSTRRAASSAKYIGMSDTNTYTDETAADGTTYYYWVQAFNTLGMGVRSDGVENTWPILLSITTSELPDATEMVEYRAQLEATGGTSPYSWSCPARGYTVTTNSTSTFAEVGTAQGWHADDNCWSLELPFDFPFYGNKYRTVYVNSNGMISFGSGISATSYSANTFLANPIVAVLWRDLLTTGSSDVYVESDTENVTIRWKAVYYNGGSDVNASIALSHDGSIKLAYGSGNDNGGFVGVSAGDGENFIIIDNTSYSRNHAQDIVMRNGGIANGLTLFENGQITGIPVGTGTNTFTVTLVDATGQTEKKELSIVVNENPNCKPVIDAVSPTTNVYVKVGDSATFAVAAHDPEGETLEYIWYLDGEEIEYAANSYTFTATLDDAGAHTLECVVSDGLWTDMVWHTWSFRVVRDWYVDASAEDDSGDGSSASAALYSISEALWYAEDGDTIYVAPGLYDDYLEFYSDRTVSIVATGGASCTFFTGQIDGYSTEWDSGSMVIQSSMTGFTFRGVYLRGATLRDCVLTCDETGCYPSASEAYGCRLFDCSVIGNTSDYSPIVQCELTRCTVAGNTVGEYGAVGYSSYVYDCIVWDNVTVNGETSNYDTETWYDEWWDDDAEEYVSEEYAEVHIFNSCTWPMPSEIAGIGNITSDPRLVDAVNGDLRLRVGSPCLVGGVQAMGVYLGDPVAGFVLSVRIEGSGAVSPMTAVVSNGGNATFEVADNTRPFLGFSTNGVLATAADTLTWQGVKSDGIITAVFSNFTFYVDAAAGDDANDGLSWVTARASIQSAINDAVRGETIYVKAGTYDPIVVGGAMRLRIESVDGKEATVIDGGGERQCANLGWNDSFSSTLIGFALTNGYSSYGGGAHGGTLVDCDVMGNYARYQGGGLYCSTAIRCQIAENKAGDTNLWSNANGGGAYSGTLRNCLVVGNTAESSNYCEGGASCYSALYNCTVVDNVARGNGYGGGVAYGNLYNSVVFGNHADYDDETQHVWIMQKSLIGVDPGFIDAENGDYRLAVGSPCIDAGSNGYVLDDADLDGNERIQHYTVDIGCYEYELATPERDAEADFAAQMAGTCYGVFVGVGQYTYTSSLTGPTIDATNMQTRCVAKGYWRDENTVAFLDAAATKSVVRARLATLAAKAVSGDTVLYYQSSHGGSHASGGNYTKDAYICLHDERYEDYEMAEDLMQFAAGVKVVIILDTCHSAGMFKAMGTSSASSAKSFALRVRDLMAERSILRKSAKSGITADDIGWIAAADFNQYSWDSLSGGAFTVAMLDGWKSGEADYDGDNRLNFHELWRYAKGIATGYYGEDATDAQCLNENVLLSRFAGMPDSTSNGESTETTPAPVEHVWLDSYPAILAAFGGDYEAMANAPSPGVSGNGKTWPNGSPCYVWQDFVAGTSPTNDTVFTATIHMNGNTPVITWKPDTPELRATRVYRTYGKKTLMDANWTDITDKDMSEYNFFKVTVDLP